MPLPPFLFVNTLSAGAAICGTHADGWFWCLPYEGAAAALPLLRLSVVVVVVVVVAVEVEVVVAVAEAVEVVEVVVVVVTALSPVTTSSFLAFFRVAIVGCKEVSGIIASTSDITASTTGLVLLAELEVYVGGLSSRAVPAVGATFSDPFSFSAGAGAGAVFLRPRPPFTENSNSGAAFEITVALLIGVARFDAAVVVGTVMSLGCCCCLLATATSTAVGLTSEEEEEDALTYTPSAFLLLVASAVGIGSTRPFLLFKEGGSSASSNSFCFSMR